MFGNLFRILLTLAACFLAAPSLSSASDLTPVNLKLQEHVYGAASLEEGIKDFRQSAGENSESNEVLFALGTLQFLHAIEGLQQDLYRFGAGNTVSGDRTLRNWLPVFRVPVPPNSEPEQLNYEKVRKLLSDFVERLEAAEQTLAQVDDEPFKSELNLLKIGFDVDGNKAVKEDEKLLNLMLTLLQQRRNTRSVSPEVTDLVVRFDNADAKWLQGYSNLLAGLGKFFLAFDFEYTYDTSFHVVFGEEANDFGRMLDRTKASPDLIAQVKAELTEVENEIEHLMPAYQIDRRSQLRRKERKIDRDKNLSDDEKSAQKAEFRSELDKLDNRFSEVSAKRSKKNQEKRAIERRLARLGEPVRNRDSYESFMEPIAFIHSINWPVENPELLKETRLHWLKVMKLNYQTWDLIQKETDDDKEWLPNANQQSPFPGVRVTQKVIDDWLKAVRTGEAVLEGEILLSSLRFGKGVNLKRFFETAQSFDPIAFATGHNSINYVEDGPILDRNFFRTMDRSLSRNFGAFAIWFN